MIKQVIILLLLIVSIRSYACSCKNFNGIEEHISNTEIIFSGTVTNVSSCELETTDDWRTHSVKMYTFKISDAYKGVKEKSIEIITGLGFGDCGDHFSIGEEYIIFAYDSGYTEKNDGLYETNICKWNGLVNEYEIYVEMLKGLKSD